MIPDSIVIDGTRQGRRFLVIVDRRTVYLQPVCFRFFAILGIQFLLGEDDGWVHASQLWHPADIVARYVYRLKQGIYNAVPRFQSWRVVENDRRGRYRLIAKPGSLVINPFGIRGFGDHELGLMVDRLLLKERSQGESQGRR